MPPGGPGGDGALGEGAGAVGDDEVGIEVDGVAEALAARAGAERIIEREEAGLRFLVERAVIFAFEALVESEALRRIAGRVGDKFQHGLAASFAITDLDGIHETRAGFGIHREPVHEDVDGLREIHVEKRFRGGKFVHAIVLE